MREDSLLRPDSPYGVTKLAAENLGYLYYRNYRVPTISLRYFTVYGPRQRPDMAIHNFVRAVLSGDTITVHGDGEQTRDFVNVKDVVKANITAATSSGAVGEKINIGTGKTQTINHLANTVKELVGEVEIGYEEPRVGDVLESVAEISKARKLLGFEPSVSFEEGLREIIEVKRGEMG